MKVPKCFLEEYPKEQAARLSTDYLEELFEICQSNNA